MTTIELRNVSRWYGNVVAVNDVTMSIEPGVTGLLGPNGAGKSTIMHMIAGFLPPSRGELTIGHRSSWRDPSDQAEETVTDVVAKGGALVRSRMAVEKGDVLSFEIGKDYKTRSEVMYVSTSSGDGILRLGLRFLDAPLPDRLIPADAKPLP